MQVIVAYTGSVIAETTGECQRVLHSKGSLQDWRENTLASLPSEFLSPLYSLLTPAPSLLTYRINMKFNPVDIPDLSGKVIFVTGGRNSHGAQFQRPKHLLQELPESVERRSLPS
jgi:hypothetical protein